MLNTEAKLLRTDVLFYLDGLIFQYSLENVPSLHYPNIAPSVHAELNAMSPEFRYKLRTGKLASLIRIENLRFPIGIHNHF